MTSQDKRDFGIGIALFLAVVAGWAAGFWYAPVDMHQGEIYRIIFLHVPAAFAAFASSLLLFIYSIIALRKRSDDVLLKARATAEVGLLFTILTLATGSIWGKPTWGIWWTWDARLTTTFLLALLYAGYLLLHAGMAPGTARVRACSVLGILIFADVPIIYKSVSWWRTLHQPPSMMRAGGSTMDPEILYTLVTGIVLLCVFGYWLTRLRATNLKLQSDLEALSYEHMRG